MKNLKFEKNKKQLTSLSLILLLLMTMTMTITQSSLAQVGVPQPEKTTGYISLAPTLVGVGQEATVNLWVYPMPTTFGYSPYYQGFFGITVTFVKPDGTKDTFMPTDGTGQYVAGQASALGSIYFYYKPNMAGNWSVSFTMPAQNITDSEGTVQYLGCTSNTAYFTVQTDHVNAGLLDGYPWSPLPNENTFWSYPINCNNREWSTISGDWTGMTMTTATVISPTGLRWQPYGTGPNTSHIVWTNPIKNGGIIGGAYGSISNVAGVNDGTVVMGGKVFYNIPNKNPSQFICIDESTGQVLYTANGSVSSGIHIPGNAYVQSTATNLVLLESSSGAGFSTYLYGTSGSTWNYYDPFTGTLKRSIVNCGSGARLVDGTELAYGVGTLPGQTGRYVYCWNMTKVPTSGTNANNWTMGIVWSKLMPTPLVTYSGIIYSLYGISTDQNTIVAGVSRTNQFWAYNAKTGASLWNLTLNYPVLGNEAFCMQGVDKFIVFDPTAATFKCYSTLTGTLLWETPSLADSPWATTWTLYRSVTNDLNNLYFALPDGSIRAFSLTDGHLVWTSTAIPSTEYANNAIPLVAGGLVLVDGKLYVYAGYSINYQINPVPRFATLICIDATNGDTLFTLNGGVAPAAAANGYLIGGSTFDGNMYCLGKGQTSTTVTIQNNVVTNHATALITGNVLDQSLAQPGTPAVSDDSMSEWMDYLHMQNATLLNNPPTPEGVQVTLTAVDSNGNTITIGTTTTTSEGNYAIKFVPENVGTYAITASFGGTHSYWPSDSQAMMEVIAAPETTPTSKPLANPPYELYTIGSAVAVIIALAIAVLLLRKKP